MTMYLSKQRLVCLDKMVQVLQIIFKAIVKGACHEDEMGGFSPPPPPPPRMKHLAVSSGEDNPNRLPVLLQLLPLGLQCLLDFCRCHQVTDHLLFEALAKLSTGMCTCLWLPCKSHDCSLTSDWCNQSGTSSQKQS